jgi:hypothetical protein
LGANPTLNTLEFNYSYFLNNVVPDYKDVFRNTRSPEMTGTVMDGCRRMLDAFSDRRLADSDIPKREEFIQEIEAFLDRQKTIEEQKTTEKSLRDFRVDFIIHELSLLDARTVNEIFWKFSINPIEDTMPNSKFNDENVRKFLCGKTNPERKRDFCRVVTSERKKVKAMYAVSGVAVNIVLALLFSLAMSAVVFVAGYLINSYLSAGYHASIYVFAAILTFFVSIILYIDSWRLKGTHNVLLRAVSQTVILIVIAMTLYVLTQWVLMNMLS